MSDDALNLRTLEAFRPLDINPHRYASREETQRLKDACLEDDRRAAAEEAEWLRGQGLAWSYQYEEDDPSANGDTADVPFCDPAFLRGLLWGIGLTAAVGLLLAMWVLGPMLRH